MEDILSTLNAELAKAQRVGATVNSLTPIRNKALSGIKQAEWEMNNSFTTISETTQVAVQAQTAFTLALEATLVAAPGIYAKKVAHATKTNDEFSIPEFSVSLLEVGDNPDLYSIVPKGRGWTKSILVKLEMNRIAGEIDDYAQAVLAVRAEIAANSASGSKGKHRQNSAAVASRLWKGIYKNTKGGGQYDDTIQSRINLMTSKAPFWSLLNDGNKIVMSSNWGGTPFPNRKGTHFVEETESAIVAFFDKEMRTLRNKGTTVTETKTVPITRSDLKLLIDDLWNIVRDIDLNLVNIESNYDKADIYVEKLKIDKGKVDKHKIYKAISDLKAGRELSKWGVNVGEPGHRKRVSPSKFRKMLED